MTPNALLLREFRADTRSERENGRIVEIEIKSIPPQMPHSRGERDTAAFAIDDPDVTYRESTTQQGHSTHGKVLQENGAAYNYCLL